MDVYYTYIDDSKAPIIVEDKCNEIEIGGICVSTIASDVRLSLATEEFSFENQDWRDNS